MITATILAAAAQVGPALPGDPNAVVTLPPQPPRASAEAGNEAPALSSRLERCLSVVATNPADALTASEAWAREVSGLARAEAGHCQGLALVQLGRFDEAQAAFVSARDGAGEEPAYAARLGGLAGNAALLAGDAAGAVALLDGARAEALKVGEQELALGLQLDAAAARVQAGQVAEAQASLRAARETWPANAQVWLMSATLSRGAGNLAEAQALIERAAELAPREPRVALEAGIIAALGGRTQAAEASWRSVLAVAPGSPAAEAARGYLAQLGVETPTTSESDSR